MSNTKKMNFQLLKKRRTEPKISPYISRNVEENVYALKLLEYYMLLNTHPLLAVSVFPRKKISDQTPLKGLKPKKVCEPGKNKVSQMLSLLCARA